MAGLPGLRILLRRDTAAEWAADNPVLKLGETGWTTDTRRVKLGDGVTAWNDLPYAADEAASVQAETDRAEAAEQALADDITAEATTRANADTNEATARANADNNLQDQIDNITGSDVETVAGVPPVGGDVPTVGLKTALSLPADTAGALGDVDIRLDAAEGELAGRLSDATLSATYGAGAGVGLKALGLTDSTPDISTIIAAGVAAGHKHLVVPYRAAAWPALTTISLIDVWLEFEPGARISVNHGSAALALLRARLTNASLTSIYTVPASAADATSPNFALPAREVTLNDNCLIDGSFYQEYATNGIHFVGAHSRVIASPRFKNMRHQKGWASCIHSSGSGAYDNRVLGAVWAEDCDRALENEDGAHDIQYLGSGYLKNIYPNGYSGQPGDYATYTFVLDAHAHSGTGGVWDINFAGRWVLENCGTAVTFVRSSGTASDVPRNCRAEDVVMIGRGLASGYEDIALQGNGHRVGRIRFEVGAGIAGGAYRIKGMADSSDNDVAKILTATSAAKPTITDDGTGLLIRGQQLPLSGSQRSGKFLSLPNRPVTTSNALGNGTFRTTAIQIPHAITVDQLGAEITAAGDAGSTLRIGIYNDLQGLPGTVLAEAVVAADAIATPMTTLGSPVTLEPGIYHVGAVVQGVTSVQPTVRVTTTAEDGVLIFNPATTTVAPVGYSKGGVTGALAAWGTSIATTNLAARIWARVTSAT